MPIFPLNSSPTRNTYVYIRWCVCVCLRGRERERLSVCVWFLSKFLHTTFNYQLRQAFSYTHANENTHTHTQKHAHTHTYSHTHTHTHTLYTHVVYLMAVPEMKREQEEEKGKAKNSLCRKKILPTRKKLSCLQFFPHTAKSENRFWLTSQLPLTSISFSTSFIWLLWFFLLFLLDKNTLLVHFIETNWTQTRWWRTSRDLQCVFVLTIKCYVLKWVIWQQNNLELLLVIAANLL